MTTNYFTASFNALPAVNFGTFLAAILIGLPVWGFLPVLAALLETEKVPKPTRVTLPPFFSPFLIASRTALTTPAASALLQVVFATTLTRSSLFILHPPFLVLFSPRRRRQHRSFGIDKTFYGRIYKF